MHRRQGRRARVDVRLPGAEDRPDVRRDLVAPAAGGKIPAERVEELVAAGQAEPFEPVGGRRMNGWGVLGKTVEWDPGVAEARAWTTSER